MIKNNVKGMVIKVKKIKSIIACCLLVFLSFCFIVSCNGSSVKVFEYGKSYIGDDVYRYWLSYYKTYYTQHFTDVSDTQESWQSEVSEGVTREQYVIDTVNDRMKMYAVALQMFDEYSLSLTSDEKDAINKSIDSLIDSFGSKSVLENYLTRTANVSVSTLKEVYTIEKKISKLNTHLFGDQGIGKLSDNQLDSFYKSNYSRIKYLYFDKQNKYVLDGEGNLIQNSSGTYETQPLTEEEKEELKNRVDEALLAAQSGEDFNALIEKYNTPDMRYSEKYPNGFYISSTSYTSSEVYTLVSNGIKMDEGKIELFEDDSAYYIIAKYELEDKMYSKDADGQFASFENEAKEFYFSSMLSERTDDVKLNEDFLSKVKISDVGKNMSF